MSKPWGGAGTWADDAERAEVEEREHLASNPVIESSFPSLKDSIAAKPNKKKNKGKTLTLSEFTTGIYQGPGVATKRGDFSIEPKGLTPDEMFRLPTGPRERSAEEMDGGRFGIGGGFKNYGSGGGGGGGGGGRSQGPSWGSGGGGRRPYGDFDDERRSERPPPRVSDIDMPSRADEVDNWALGKKPLPRMDSGGGRDNRYGGPVDSGRQDKYSSLGGGSRADEVDNWGANKKPLPVRSTSNFGSGYRDTNATEADRWTRTGPLPSHEYPPREERQRLVLDPPRGDVSLNEAAKSTRPSIFGAARPREEILAEKGLDYKKLDSDIETKKTSRPTSSHSAHSSGYPENLAPQVLEEVPKPRPKVNPFGDAKPREVLLEEKGIDWQKKDLELEHRSVDRPETMEEQVLKDEIDHLKKALENEAQVNVNGELVQGSGMQSGLHNELLHKEKELELLIRELDDKVRFGQKATGAGRSIGFSERPGSGGGRSTGFSERPGSGGGRSSGFPERPGSGGGRSFSERPGSGSGRSIGNLERPPSQSSRPDEFRNVEYIDRPRSHGTGDAWTRPGDDRRAFQGTRDRGFLNSRDDRPRSRERW